MMRQTARDLFGDDSLVEDEPGMGGEDFSYMTRKAPGAMFHLGAKLDEVDRPHHNPRSTSTRARSGSARRCWRRPPSGCSRRQPE
ncbi:MAG: hypothetical protein U0521_30055 [Anaerolineae bacterium]